MKRYFFFLLFVCLSNLISTSPVRQSSNIPLSVQIKQYQQLLSSVRIEKCDVQHQLADQQVTYYALEQDIKKNRIVFGGDLIEDSSGMETAKLVDRPDPNQQVTQRVFIRGVEAALPKTVSLEQQARIKAQNHQQEQYLAYLDMQNKLPAISSKLKALEQQEYGLSHDILQFELQQEKVYQAEMFAEEQFEKARLQQEKEQKLLQEHKQRAKLVTKSVRDFVRKKNQPQIDEKSVKQANLQLTDNLSIFKKWQSTWQQEVEKSEQERLQFKQKKEKKEAADLAALQEKIKKQNSVYQPIVASKKSSKSGPDVCTAPLKLTPEKKEALQTEEEKAKKKVQEDLQAEDERLAEKRRQKAEQGALKKLEAKEKQQQHKQAALEKKKAKPAKQFMTIEQLQNQIDTFLEQPIEESFQQLFTQCDNDRKNSQFTAFERKERMIAYEKKLNFSGVKDILHRLVTVINKNNNLSKQTLSNGSLATFAPIYSQTDVDEIMQINNKLHVFDALLRKHGLDFNWYLRAYGCYHETIVDHQQQLKKLQLDEQNEACFTVLRETEDTIDKVKATKMAQILLYQVEDQKRYLSETESKEFMDKIKSLEDVAQREEAKLLTIINSVQNLSKMREVERSLYGDNGFFNDKARTNRQKADMMYILQCDDTSPVWQNNIADDIKEGIIRSGEKLDAFLKSIEAYSDKVDVCALELNDLLKTEKNTQESRSVVMPKKDDDYIYLEVTPGVFACMQRPEEDENLEFLR